MDSVAVIIPNYNMPERTDAICKHLMRTVNHPFHLVVVDNGSDLVEPSQFTRVYLDKNLQTTGGFIAGIEYAQEHLDAVYYWFIITSTEFDDQDDRNPLDFMLPLFDRNDNFAVHPAVEFIGSSAWERWLAPRDEGLRQIWGMDCIAALVDARKYHEIGGFNPELTMAYGLMGELNWKARRAGYRLYVQDDYCVYKETDIGYKMNRMNMTSKKRRELATKQSDDVLIPVYGEDYRERFRYEYTELGLKGDY